MRKQRFEEDDEPVGLLIGAARRRIRQATGRRARSYGLTSQQFWVVNAVVDHARLSLRELAVRLRMDEPTASRIVAGLIARGWVRVAEDPVDRRRSQIQASRRAATIAGDIRAAATHIRGAVAAGLRPHEVRMLRRLLRKVIANMDEIEGAPDGQRPRAGGVNRSAASRVLKPVTPHPAHATPSPPSRRLLTPSAVRSGVTLPQGQSPARSRSGASLR